MKIEIVLTTGPSSPAGPRGPYKINKLESDQSNVHIYLFKTFVQNEQIRIRSIKCSYLSI